ncbi:hypothetical protein ISR92_00470 [Patescibacteria group bacterium]|nr:hypothetical protein [Patescibacteria group bacterium]
MDFNKHSIKLVQNCPVCTRKYQQNRVQILEAFGNSFLAYLTCNFCNSNLIVKVISMSHGLVGNAILTDLSPEEVMSFSDGDKISSDDILNVHQSINNNEIINNLKINL